MEGPQRLQPARRRNDIEGFKTQPGELGTGTGDAAGFRTSSDAGNHKTKTTQKMTEESSSRKYGDCYESSFRSAEELELIGQVSPEKVDPAAIEIVHGWVTPTIGPDTGRRIHHAWVELPGKVFETSNSQLIPFTQDEFYDIYSVEVTRRYQLDEARNLLSESRVFKRWHS
jgi:hypothetical protein